jgi:hypothetical protein
MSNYYHLLIETPEGDLSQDMRGLKVVYTQTYNRRHNQAGHLLQGCYNAVLVEKDTYLLDVRGGGPTSRPALFHGKQDHQHPVIQGIQDSRPDPP